MTVVHRLPLALILSVLRVQARDEGVARKPGHGSRDSLANRPIRALNVRI
jgi:hypothetical protein